MTTSVQKHFELTSESKVDSFGGTLFRVRLTIDCKWGKAGDLGGWVQKDENIQGFAWVSDNAQVYGNAQVSGNAWIYGDAQISGNAQVYGGAWGTSPLQIQGSRHTLTECKKGFLQIGCKCYTFEEWELHFEAIGKAEGYSEDQIQEYKSYIDLAVNLRSLRYGNEKI